MSKEMTTPAYFDTAWFQTLKNEIGSSNITKVAEKIGISRPTLSIFMHGKGLYGNGKASSANIEIRFRQAYEKLVCPHTASEVGIAHCRQVALCPAPNHNPLKMVQWQACQQCSYKPNAIVTDSITASKPASVSEQSTQQAGIIDKVTLPLPVVGGPQVNDSTNQEAA